MTHSPAGLDETHARLPLYRAPRGGSRGPQSHDSALTDPNQPRQEARRDSRRQHGSTPQWLPAVTRGRLAASSPPFQLAPLPSDGQPGCGPGRDPPERELPAGALVSSGCGARDHWMNFPRELAGSRAHLPALSPPSHWPFVSHPRPLPSPPARMETGLRGWEAEARRRVSGPPSKGALESQSGQDVEKRRRVSQSHSEVRVGAG